MRFKFKPLSRRMQFALLPITYPIVVCGMVVIWAAVAVGAAAIGLAFFFVACFNFIRGLFGFPRV